MAARSSLSLRHRTKPRAQAVASLAAAAVIAALLATDATSALAQAQPVQPPTDAVTAGDAHSCALRTDGTITCWGNNEWGQADAPGGSFSAVTAGGAPANAHSCALRTDSTVTCWGNNEWGQADAPGGSFSAVTAGAAHSCALRTDSTITCWGNNKYGQADAPGGSFSAVTAGGAHSCALRTDSTITCWSDYPDDVADAPGGSFSAVTAGAAHSCALRTDSTITCWGYKKSGVADAPGGSFSAVTAGHYHSCGLRTDGTITCWGSNGYGQADAPGGSFSAVTAGGAYSCALRTDSTITCWGSNGRGQADPPDGQFGPQAQDTPSPAGDTSAAPTIVDTPEEPAREGVPGAVGGLTATPLPGGGVLVDWSAPSDDGDSAIVRYDVTYSRGEIYYGGSSRDSWHITKQVRVTSVFDRALRGYRQSLATSHLNLRLYPGVDYSVSVTAVNSSGSGRSATTEFRTFDVPGIPRSVQVAPLHGGGVEVSWSAPSDGGSPILRYEVEYSRDALHGHENYSDRGAWSITKTVRGTSHAYSRLLAGVRYWVTVTAVNRVGSSDSTIARVFVTRQPCPTGDKFKIKKDPWWQVFGRETRVVALQDFVTIDNRKVEAGDTGGKVSDEGSLSQSGCSWIFDDAEVSDDAHVSGNAVVGGSARVYDNSRIYGNARVHGDARVYGDAAVYGDASVFGDARVYGNARVHGSVRVRAKSKVYGSAELFGTASFPSVEEDQELFEAEFPGLEADTGQFDGEQEHRRAGQKLYRAMRAHFTNRLIECDRPIREYEGNDIPTIVDSLLSKDRNNDIRPVSEALLIVCKEVIGLREATGFFLPTWWDLIFPMAKSLPALKRAFYLKSLIELVETAKPFYDLSKIPNAASMWDEFEKCDSRSC